MSGQLLDRANRRALIRSVVRSVFRPSTSTSRLDTRSAVTNVGIANRDALDVLRERQPKVLRLDDGLSRGCSDSGLGTRWRATKADQKRAEDQGANSE